MSDTYDLDCVCDNCGQKLTAKIDKGMDRQTWEKTHNCPCCNCGTLKTFIKRFYGN